MSRGTMLIVWSAPLGLAALMVGANLALAGALARLFADAGLAPAGGAAGLGFWAAYFGALALANLPALSVCGAWARAEEQERAARAEVLTAMRWPARLDRWQPALWPGVAAPATAGDRHPAGTRPPRSAFQRHLPYLMRFLGALASPVALLGLLTTG